MLACGLSRIWPKAGHYSRIIVLTLLLVGFVLVGQEGGNYFGDIQNCPEISEYGGR